MILLKGTKKYTVLRDEIIRLEQRMDEAMEEYISLRKQAHETRDMLMRELERNQESVKTYREWMR